ncbi:hypothetical protein Q1695_003661 [Nippostrongylus brasiliensis]|nr:hypothetical protein Q1695_003661 [Nippostrongylus brasiliensis]
MHLACNLPIAARDSAHLCSPRGMFSMVVIVLAASAVLACQPGVGYAYCPTCFRFARKADQADQIGYGSVAGGKLPHEIKAYSIQMKTMSKS